MLPKKPNGGYDCQCIVFSDGGRILVSRRALGPVAERVAIGERIDQLKHVALVRQTVQLLEARLDGVSQISNGAADRSETDRWP